jgi:membrane protein
LKTTHARNEDLCDPASLHLPRNQEIITLVRQTTNAWIEDYAPSMGAALAYYTMFSMAPLLLIVIAVAGWVFGADAARGEILAQLSDLIGHDGAQMIEEILKSARRPQDSFVATVVGVGMLLVGATSVFSELQDALDRIWRAPARTRHSGVFTLLRARVLSFGMILGIAFLLMVSLVVSASLSALGKWWGPMLASWANIAQVVDFAASFTLITVMFALIYKVMPRVKVAWRDVWIGAVVTSLMFSIGKFLIGLYIGRSAVASGFGAAGSLVALLLWVYYSAQIFLLGAEFTWVYAHALGSRRQQLPPAKELGNTA